MWTLRIVILGALMLVPGYALADAPPASETSSDASSERTSTADTENASAPIQMNPPPEPNGCRPGC